MNRQGMFIRHRANGQSVRLRRKREDVMAQARRSNRYSGDYEYSVRRRASEERQRAFSNDWDDGGRGAPQRKSHRKTRSAMETLDRRISVSTDQLDTLKREKVHEKLFNGERAPRPRSTSRHLFENVKVDDNNNNNEESNEWNRREHMLQELAQRTGRSTSNDNRQKTAFDMFLEDEGPYSRRLYGPPPPEETETKKGRTKMYSQSQEALSRNSEQDQDDPDDTVFVDNIPPKKGLLWQQRDKLFSRWKERYFVLTKDYFHCFKKGTSRITEMGGFIFKVKLIDIESVELLDKRGYLTVCISLIKEGKIYLRRPEGIREWFHALQNNVYECKRKRNFWTKRQSTDSSGIEQWLLTRQKAASGSQYPYRSPAATSESSPNLLERTSREDEEAHRIGSPIRKGLKEFSSHQNFTEPVFPPAPPRGINRISLVNELILKEKLTDKVGASLDSKDSSFASEGSAPQPKPSHITEDSGHDSGHNSMNTNSSDNQSDGPSSGGEDANKKSYERTKDDHSEDPGKPSIMRYRVKATAPSLAAARKTIYRKNFTLGQPNVLTQI